MILCDVCHTITRSKAKSDEGVGQAIGFLGEVPDSQLAPTAGFFDCDIARGSALDLAHELHHRLGNR